MSNPAKALRRAIRELEALLATGLTGSANGSFLAEVGTVAWLAHRVQIAVVESAGVVSEAVDDTLSTMVDEVVDCNRAINIATALRTVAVDRLRLTFEADAAARIPATRDGWTAARVAAREVTTEVAAALQLPPARAATLLHEAKALVHEFPATLAAISTGVVAYTHAKVLVDESQDLPDAESKRVFEAALLPIAGEVTAAKLAKRARRLRERSHPESLTVRTERCVADRRIWLTPERDGMATLSAYLPAPVAIGILNKLTARARSLRSPAEPRTQAQIKADVLADLLVDGHTEGDWPVGVQATVLVTVPALSLMDRLESPGMLEGCGPIDADTARFLAGTGKEWMRLLTHPETGAPLSLGRDRYKVPKELRVYLRAMDGTCRAPGCNRPASECDIDHTIAWVDGGTTDLGNLACLCGGDHALKHNTRWEIEQCGGGVLKFTSPAGKTYTTSPEELTEPPYPDGAPEPPPDPQSVEGIGLEDFLTERERVSPFQTNVPMHGVPGVTDEQRKELDQSGASLRAAQSSANERDAEERGTQERWDGDETPPVRARKRMPVFEPTPLEPTPLEPTPLEPTPLEPTEIPNPWESPPDGNEEPCPF